jgi:flagellar hook-basal body complex protein FliE
MSLPIAPIGASSGIAAPVSISGGGQTEPGLFQTMLAQSVSSVEQTGANAQATVDRFLSGQGEEVHQVALATQEAELSFDLFLQVRNKVVSAYQEVMRMQV